MRHIQRKHHCVCWVIQHVGHWIIPIDTFNLDVIYQYNFKLLLFGTLADLRGNAPCCMMSPTPTLQPPTPQIVPIVWVRRVMADFGLGQSLNRAWLLQGSTPSDAKAARGLTGSQPQHLNSQTTLTRLSVYCKITDKDPLDLVSSGKKIWIPESVLRNFRGVNNIESCGDTWF